MSDWRFARYVSVGEKRAKALKKLKQLRKKNPNIEPVVVEGRTLAKTWWGKAWNNNLERYADYANRIGRGRSYIRHRAVLDLQIEPGKVTALVQGSRSTPYSVSIKLRKLSKKTWREITTVCSGKFKSLQDLLMGKFPEALSEIFTARGTGLFPSPKEIDFQCSCPDWAYMCKHVAASLYGIGARLDEDPSLFFKLRKVKMDDLATEAIKETTGKLLEKADKRKMRVIADADLENVFGIIMEDQVDFGKKATSGNRSMAHRTHNMTKRGRSGVPAKKRNLSVVDDKIQVINIIEKSKPGVRVPEIKKRSGLDTVKIRNIVYNAYKKGIIEKAGRGLYRRKISAIGPEEQIKTVLSLIGRSKNGITVPAIKKEFDITDSKVRYIIAHAMADGKIKRISRGVYTIKRNRSIPLTVSDTVLKIIEKSRSGIGFPQLKETSGLDEKKLRNIIFRLTRLKRIKSIRRGVYAII
ncbi:MAG: hypothetical protein JRE14_05825 [Deltaproteobacteria bacterium]|nr:hypothetical protein [Deltaproteobacteria bacterium]